MPQVEKDNMNLHGNRIKVKNINKQNRKLPRLSVFRSNRFISAQIIDDEQGITLLSASSKSIATGKPTEKAAVLGKTIAEFAKNKKITEVVFDRNNYRYHGSVKSFAEAARDAGLKF